MQTLCLVWLDLGLGNVIGLPEKKSYEASSNRVEYFDKTLIIIFPRINHSLFQDDSAL